MAKILMTEVKGYAKLAGWTGEDLDIATAIAAAESGLDPEAKGGPNSNGTYDYGLWQINDIHKPTDDEKTDPWKNAERAYKIYQAAGNKFTPWSTYNNGKYKEFLDKAKGIDGTAPGGSPEAQVQQNPPDNPFAALAGIGTTIMRSISSTLVVIVGAILLILGIVIVLRSPIGKTAAKGVGIAAKAAI